MFFYETSSFKGGGVLVEFQENFSFSFELLIFPCREMIKLAIHTVYVACFQNESIYIQKTVILCDACIFLKLKRMFQYNFFLAHFQQN